MLLFYNMDNDYTVKIIATVLWIAILILISLNCSERFDIVDEVDWEGTPDPQDPEANVVKTLNVDTDPKSDAYEWSYKPQVSTEGDTPEMAGYNTNVKNLNERQLLKASVAGLDIMIPVDRNNKGTSKPQGWWADVINCEGLGNNNLYCKPKESWIWPY